jgi:hypothetical protein
MRIFLVVVATLSCLVGSAGLWVCQKAGWHSDGPGLLCPMIVMAGGYFVAAIALWTALTSGGKQPII